jgi:competence protein ComEC
MFETRGRLPALVTATAYACGVLAAGFAAGSGAAKSPLRYVLPATGLILCAPAAVNAVRTSGLDGTLRRKRSCTRGGRRRLSVAPRVPPSTALVGDAALLVALTLSGWSLHDASHRMVQADHVGAGATSAPVVVRARVVEVRRSPQGHANVVLGVVEVRDASAPGLPGRPASGLVWMRWPDGAGRPARSDVVVAAGDLVTPRGPRNPGGFDFRAYLGSRRIHHTLVRARVHAHETASGRARLPEWIYRTLPRRVPGLQGEVLRGLMLGTGRELPDELTDSFRRSGTVHVLAVSGLHVGFIVLIIHALLRALRTPRRLARLLALPALVCFVVIVGPRASVVRASTMAAFLLTAPLLERRPNSLNTLGAAALALLVARPGALFDLGFQLSFCAVGGILLLQRPIRDALARPLGALGPQASRLAVPLALSLSAQLGVSPVLIAAFGEISVVSPLANLAVVPLAGVAVASGVATLALDPVGAWPASAFAACAWGAIRLLVLVAETLGGCPWATVRVASRFWPVAAFGVAGLGLRMRATSRPGGRAGAAVLAGAALVAAALVFFGPGRSFPRVVFLDVGQGDSVLLELPRRRYALVDAGPGPAPGGEPWRAGPRDAGRVVVVPYLRREGVTRLAGLAVTHAHADHFGGASAVVRAVEVDTLYLPAGGRAKAGLDSLAALAERRGATVREVRSGDAVTLGGVRFDVLWPEGPGVAARPENDRSLVLRGLVSGHPVLLTGDIESRSEERLCGAGTTISASVLKVPHHGSRTSSTEQFVRRVSPRLAVVQVGGRNRHGHPSAEALRRLEAAGATVVRTDLDGAVVLSFRGGTACARTVASGRSWTFDGAAEPRRGGTIRRRSGGRHSRSPVPP